MNTVGVVVATHRRPLLLRRCLEALAAQTRPANAVVVVDDGSGPETAAVLGEFADRLPLRVLRNAVPRGPARAREAGWRLLDTDAIAFTDDDCRPDPGWLEALLRVAAPGTVVCGATVVDPADGAPASVFDRTMVAAADNGRFSTCNILYDRRLLLDVGGFDPQFDRYGEDTDLGRRALASGARAVAAPDAVVRHAVHRAGPAAVVRERWRTGEVARLVRRHPALRQEMWRGVWWKEEHRRAALAAVGLATAPAVPAAAVLAAPWLELARARVEELRRAGRWGRWRLVCELAGLALLDATEMAACAWGSARHRTLFL